MFYCDNCARKNGWPTTGFISRGTCEICRKTSDCSDMPSKHLPKPEPKVKLSFAPIDARDNHLVGIEGSNGWVSRPRSEHNARLMFKVTRHYLEKLKDLQEGIISEFGPQFEDESGIESEDGFCGTNNCPCKKDENSRAPCDLGRELQDLYYH